MLRRAVLCPEESDGGCGPGSDFIVIDLGDEGAVTVCSGKRVFLAGFADKPHEPLSRCMTRLADELGGTIEREFFRINKVQDRRYGKAEGGTGFFDSRNGVFVALFKIPGDVRQVGCLGVRQASPLGKDLRDRERARDTIQATLFTASAWAFTAVRLDTTWPIPPAIPLVPCIIRPWVTRPHPIPSSSSMAARGWDPLSAPKTYSYSAIALASLSMTAGRPVAFLQRPHEAENHPTRRVGPNTTLPLRRDTWPPSPTPRPTRSAAYPAGPRAPKPDSGQRPRAHPTCRAGSVADPSSRLPRAELPRVGIDDGADQSMREHLDADSDFQLGRFSVRAGQAGIERQVRPRGVMSQALRRHSLRRHTTPAASSRRPTRLASVSSMPSRCASS